MKTIVSYEKITCDMCGNDMTTDDSKVILDGIYIGEKYATGIVDVSALYLCKEHKCLCRDCKKAILQAAIDRL